ncbi:glycerophosphodiester phosphodiesterase family protein [Microbacterium sp. BK668]|uniref:glycerophosphodiester phosphodiesterase family protein n=1 Tax=Microbacterium sp. BK668 TaxID=2512118 RepID=UPI00105F10AF|nr:glycerophosphodiester phosphodiesterase family protein [Microbacterium sp. BK668]TDN93011.1 glycerophosphoryl diester phosphodiesterase [Microbacterium sp. BK668]
MTHPWFAGPPRPRVLAHRGLVTPDGAAAGIAENSFAAVAEAHAAGAHYVESDCHLTRDGVVVLFHDPDLSRVTGDTRRVDEVSLRTLADLMSGHGGVITLEQALDAFPDVHWNLDVKAAAAAEEVGRIVAPHAARVLVTSFSDDRRRAALAAAAAAGADLTPATSAGTSLVSRLVGAVSLRSRRVARRVLRNVDAVQVPERQGRLRIVTPRLIDYAHAAGVEVHVWTVNDPDDMTRLVTMGVDGIVTDRADVALRTLS